MTLEYPYDELDVGPALATGGGQGIVYAVSNARINASIEVVYKEYHRAAIPPDWRVLRQLVDVRENLALPDRRQLVARTAWPLAIVTRAGRPVGILMRKAPQDFWFNSTGPGGTKRKLAELKFLLNSDKVLQGRGIAPPTREARYQLVLDAATTLALLHDAHLGVGDISAGNLLFSLQGVPRAFFIDCDSMSLHGRTALEQPETANWSIKDAFSREARATADSDVYKLGLVALRVLAGSQNAFGLDSLPKGVHPAVRNLIQASTSQPAGRRPTARDWIAELTDVAAPTAPRSAPQVRAGQGRTRPSQRPDRSPVTTDYRLPAKGTTADTERGIQGRQRRLVLGLGAAIAALVVLSMLRGLTTQGGGPDPETATRPIAHAPQAQIGERVDDPFGAATAVLDEPSMPGDIAGLMIDFRALPDVIPAS